MIKSKKGIQEEGEGPALLRRD